MTRRQHLASLAAGLLGAVVVASMIWNPARAAPNADIVRIGGGYPVNVVKIPVDDPATKYVAGALFEPGGTGPFPVVILIGAADDWTPADRCQAITDTANVEVVVYPDALQAFAMPILDMVYLSHHVAYQDAAATDAQRRALSMIK